MHFDSIDLFLKYYYDNDLKINDIDFNIAKSGVDTDTTSGDPVSTPDVIQEPPEEVDIENQGSPITESVTLRLASGDVNVQLDVNNYLVVESFDLIPNACGTGYVVIEGRKVHLNMCEIDGKTIAYLPTGTGVGTPIAVRTKN